MKIVHDKEADAVYIYFIEGRVRSARTYGDWPFHVDVNDKGEVIGIEIMDVSIVLNKDYLASSSVPIGVVLFADQKILASRLLGEALQREGLISQTANLSKQKVEALKQKIDSHGAYELTESERVLFDAVLDQIINSKELADLPEDEVLELSESIKRWQK